MKVSELIDEIKDYPDLEVRLTTDNCILEPLHRVNPMKGDRGELIELESYGL